MRIEFETYIENQIQIKKVVSDWIYFLVKRSFSDEFPWTIYPGPLPI